MDWSSSSGFFRGAMPTPANSVTLAAVELQEVLQLEGIPFCFIGGLAVQRWGEPRVTVDADATILTRFVDDEKWTDQLLASFRPRRPDARAFALRHQSPRTFLLRLSRTMLKRLPCILTCLTAAASLRASLHDVLRSFTPSKSNKM